MSSHLKFAIVAVTIALVMLGFLASCKMASNVHLWPSKKYGHCHLISVKPMLWQCDR